MRTLEKTDVSAGVTKLNWALGTDPVSQAALWMPQMLYRWQVNVLRDCMVQGNQVAVVTPNESGKTSVVIPTLGLSWMSAFPGSQVVSTAGVERQIKRQLWPVLHASLAKYPNWTMSDDDLKIRAPSVDGLPGSTWESFTTKEPDYAEGFHSRVYEDADGRTYYSPLLIIVDEAKSFQDQKGRDLMFAFAKRCDPDVLLMISTPGEDAGPFYDAFHAERGKPWICHEIGWEDCPHLRQGVKLIKRQQEIERWGQNHPRVLSWVFGKFYRAEARVVFDRWEDVEVATSGSVTKRRGERRAAIDFSGGGDEQVFGYRDGNEVYPLEFFHEKDDMKLADMLVKRFKRYGLSADEITGDNGGSGKTCIDILAAKGYAGVRRYMSNDVARDAASFRFRITEDHFHLRDLLKWQGLSLPNDPVLLEEMRKRKYLVLNDENLMQIEPKEKMRNRGEGSPNRLDTLVMLTADAPVPSVQELLGQRFGSKRPRGICPDPDEVLAEIAEANQGGMAVWAND